MSNDARMKPAVVVIHGAGTQENGQGSGSLVSHLRGALEASAEAAAQELVEQTGWDVERREDVLPLAADHYAEGEAGREYMQQAREDGICAVFHRWNADAPDE